MEKTGAATEVTNVMRTNITIIRVKKTCLFMGVGHDIEKCNARA